MRTFMPLSAAPCHRNFWHQQNRTEQKQAYISVASILPIHIVGSWHSIVSYDCIVCIHSQHVFRNKRVSKTKHTSEYFCVVYTHRTSHTRCKTNNSWRTTTAWQWMGKCLKRNRMKSERNENWRTSVINSHNENQLNLFKTKMPVRSFKCSFSRSPSSCLMHEAMFNYNYVCTRFSIFLHETHTVSMSALSRHAFIWISDRAGCSGNSSSGDGGSKRIQIKLASI